MPMITAAIAADAIERMRDRCLPGREAVECGDVWSTITRSATGVRTERRIIISVVLRYWCGFRGVGADQ
jgi:hypothetical protein